jgi:hypothetical protein
MLRTNPTFGERTKDYPHGYGYCQCGCSQVTHQALSGVYARYVRGHHLKRLPTSVLTLKRKAFRRKALMTAKTSLEQKPRSNNKNMRIQLPSEPDRSAPIDRVLLDRYHELFREHELLRREAQLLRAGIEAAIELLENFGSSHDDIKGLAVKKLRKALSEFGEP